MRSGPILEAATGDRNREGIGLSYRPPGYIGWRNRFLGINFWPRARICKRLWSPGIDSEESILPAYVAWRASTSKRVVVPAHQAGNRFLGSLKGLQIRAQEFSLKRRQSVGALSLSHLAHSTRIVKKTHPAHGTRI